MVISATQFRVEPVDLDKDGVFTSHKTGEYHENTTFCSAS
jgi:hypothetical protein